MTGKRPYKVRWFSGDDGRTILRSFATWEGAMQKAREVSQHADVTVQEVDSDGRPLLGTLLAFNEAIPPGVVYGKPRR
jgi:hypothetical protein